MHSKIHFFILTSSFTMMVTAVQAEKKESFSLAAYRETLSTPQLDELQNYGYGLENMNSERLQQEGLRQRAVIAGVCSAGATRALVSGVIGTIPFASAVQNVSRKADIPSVYTDGELISRHCGGFLGGVAGGLLDLVRSLGQVPQICDHALNPERRRAPRDFRWVGLQTAYSPALKDWADFVQDEHSTCQQAVRKLQMTVAEVERREELKKAQSAKKKTARSQEDASQSRQSEALSHIR